MSNTDLSFKEFAINEMVTNGGKIIQWAKCDNALVRSLAIEVIEAAKE